MNYTIDWAANNGSQYLAVQQKTIDIGQYMRDYCSKVDNSILWYIGIYATATFILLLSYRRGWIDMNAYAEWSNRLQTSYLMFSIIMICWLLVRNYGNPF